MFGRSADHAAVNDGPLESNLATASISIAPVNDAPVASDVYATLNEDTPLTFTLGDHVTDVDNPSPQPSPAGGEGAGLVTTRIVTGPAHGTLTLNAPSTGSGQAQASYTYTPDANYNGADSFTYQANDGALDSNIARFNLTVTPVNDAPVAHDMALYSFEDNPHIIDLRAIASDVDSVDIFPDYQHAHLTGHQKTSTYCLY